MLLPSSMLSSLAFLDYVTLGLVDQMKQLTLGLVGRGLRAADRNRAA